MSEPPIKSLEANVPKSVCVLNIWPPKWKLLTPFHSLWWESMLLQSNLSRFQLDWCKSMATFFLWWKILNKHSRMSRIFILHCDSWWRVTLDEASCYKRHCVKKCTSIVAVYCTNCTLCLYFFKWHLCVFGAVQRITYSNIAISQTKPNEQWIPSCGELEINSCCTTSTL